MAKEIPSFSYAGSYSIAADDNYWYIYLKSPGTLRMSYAKIVDVTLVGGDGNGLGREADGSGGTGRTGVVIIRSLQEDHLPIVYNGIQLSSVVYNGTSITSLYYNGTKIF